MKLRLTPLQHRLAALGILVLLLAAIVAAIAWPTWRLHRHYDEAIDDYSDRLIRYRRVAGQRPAIEEGLAAAEGAEFRKYFLKSASATLAAAELQGLVTRIVEDHKGRILSSQILPAKDDGKNGGPNKVSISVTLTASIIPLQMILHTVETNEPYLFFDQVVVRSPQGRNFRAIPGQSPEFSVQLTLHGYLATSGGAS